jgi:DNA-directed RNA polymerase beta subunit
MDDVSVIRNEDWENSHRFLAEELLMPNVNKTDGNRSTMFDAHLAQAVTLKHAEAPLVYTNFENQVGHYSTAGYKSAKSNYKVIDRIEKNDFNYVLIVQDLDTLEYTKLNRAECEWLTEHYGFQWDNSKIDSLKKDDVVERDEVLYKNTCYDENMNFGYGVNLNATYFSYKNLTLEDAIVISESASKKLGTYSVKKVEISVNTNDILLNLYGDDESYKAFPDIGEHIKNQIIASRRRVNYNTVLYELKNLQDSRDNDTPFFSDGKIVDIEIFSNIPEEELKEQKYNEQVYKYINKQKQFAETVYKRLKGIVESKTNRISDELLHFYNNCKMQIDENVFYTYQNSQFSGFIAHFTILEEEPLNIGSKITGRYGNKGVISAILPDDQMPTVAEGKFKGLRADICLNPLGVFNRLNPSQLIEQELNWIAKYIRKYIEEEGTLEGKAEILIDFLKEVNKEQAEVMNEYLLSITDEEQKVFFNDLVENGIPICQKPFFGNIGLDDVERLYDKYDEVDYFKCEGITTPLIIGETYMVRLKHEPYSKFSARSTSFMNLRGLPAKSKSFKEYKDLYSKTPVRVGNMEISNLSLTNEMDSIMHLLNAYSNNETNRREFIMQMLTGNPFDIDVELSNVESSTSKILNALFTCLGLKIEDIEDTIEGKE